MRRKKKGGNIKTANQQLPEGHEAWGKGMPKKVTDQAGGEWSRTVEGGSVKRREREVP